MMPNKVIDAELAEKISREIDRLAPELIADIQSVVRIPSVVGNEAAVQVRMRELYEESALGLEVIAVEPRIEELRDHPGFVDTQMPYDGRYSLVAKQRGKSGNSGRSLILNGHIDVVSPGPAAPWKHDPWSATIEGDWMYGRGAGDMKAGVIVNLYVLKALKNLNIDLAGDVMLQAVVDEEAGGAGGTLACLEQGYRADGMICTEPRGLNITIAHGGVSYFRVTTRGKQAHAANSHLGVNALVKMAPIIAALARLDEERGATMKHELIGAGTDRSTNLNIGTCQAGEWPSSVPSEAVIDCRIGFVPPETLHEMRAKVEATIMDACRDDPWMADNPPKIEWYGWQTGPWLQDPEAPFVQILKSEVEKVRSVPILLQGITGGIDSRFSAYYGMPAACFGPIAEKVHGVDERVNIPSIITAAKSLTNFVVNWCGLAGRSPN